MIKYFTHKGNLELWTGVEGMRRLAFERRSHQKNREAEESHARKHVWGYSGDSTMDEDENVHFGDNYYKPSPWAWLAPTLLAAAAIGGGAYWLANRTPTKPDTPPDGTVSVGLSRPEDITGFSRD